MTAQSPVSKRPPNLVVFLPDQQRVDTLACYGNEKVHAPNLNKLAAESVVFQRPYVTQPVCSPSRASLMTGLWPHLSGCTNNGFPLDPRVATLPQLIGAEYRAGYVGKWHLRDQPPTQRGFHEWISVEGPSDYSRYLIERGLKPDRQNGAFSALTISNLPLELSQADFVQQHACDFIKRNQNKPFVIVVSFVEPHAPYNGPFNEEHHLTDLDDSDSGSAAGPSAVPLRYRLLREWENDKALKQEAVRQFRYGITPDDYLRLKQRYYGLITLVDRSIGLIVTCLENAGLMDRTVIVHTSDHGDLLGAHGIFGKGVMYEPAVCVPFLIRLPDGPRKMIARRVSHIDFVPTVLDLLQRPCPDQLPGKSLVPEIFGQNGEPRNVFIEWNPYKKAEKRMKEGTTIAPARDVARAVKESTRTVVCPDGWKLSLRDNDLCELYNLQEDPGERRNLFYSGQFADVIERCRNDIQAWQKETADSVRLRSE
jgi:arylsulfatase A-like enzyme